MKFFEKVLGDPRPEDRSVPLVHEDLRTESTKKLPKKALLEDLNSGHRRRLKDRFMGAPKAIPDYELLEILLFNAIPRKDVKPLAKNLISKFGNFSNVINQDITKLKEFDPNIPPGVFFQFKLVRESIARVLSYEVKDREILGSTSALNDYLLATMAFADTESFRVLYLNTKNHLIEDEVQDAGTVDQTQVYPREIVKRAIFHAASAIILVHNHPSGICKPSKADIVMTAKIVEACKTIDVLVHDHIIVGGGTVFSFRSNNLM